MSMYTSVHNKAIIIIIIMYDTEINSTPPPTQ